ncbi:N-acetylglucosamine kinase [Eubacteriales bacterium OttesenSCG-928-A19]|nr:N-acetylglucosamine kinase [Eubacteriales bacterium OttesenSCG-928-A19]
MGYVLGVDGGNTKTDYLLHAMDGGLVGHLRAGTCSHEQIGMEGARREMDLRIGELLRAAGVARDEIIAAAFGLAGIDQPVQRAELTAIVHALGFENSIAMNDSFLGIKAGSESGTGVCSINGTGTAAGGIDADGRWMQVGGFGPLLTGDEGGGTYLAGRAIRAAYDAVFRFGPDTALLPPLLALLGCETAEDLHRAVSTEFQCGDAVKPLDVVQALFDASTAGDPVAVGIVQDTADALARTAAGCAARLRFEGAIPLVLIGSVWTKGRHRPMIDHFQARFEGYAGQPAALHILGVPPAAGSILWALELASGSVPDAALRARVIAEVEGL